MSLCIRTVPIVREALNTKILLELLKVKSFLGKHAGFRWSAAMSAVLFLLDFCRFFHRL